MSNYYDFQLNKARGKFGDKVLTFKLPCCQGKHNSHGYGSAGIRVRARGERNNDKINEKE